MSIAERIAQIRGKESRAAFSKRIGIMENTLRNYEKALSLPNSDVIATFCMNLNISPQWLLLGVGPAYMDEVQNCQYSQDKTPVQAMPEKPCTQCAELKAELEEERRERRELAAENRKLWKENGELKEKCARLEPRQRQEDVHPFDERRKISGCSEPMQNRF